MANKEPMLSATKETSHFQLRCHCPSPLLSLPAGAEAVRLSSVGDRRWLSEDSFGVSRKTGHRLTGPVPSHDSGDGWVISGPPRGIRCDGSFPGTAVQAMEQKWTTVELWLVSVG